MILNELKIVFRRLLRQKVFLGINLVGLTLGIVFAILAFLSAQNEFRYDKHFTNTENTYLMACNNGRNHLMHYGQPARFMDEILIHIPEVESGVRLKWEDENLKINNNRIKAIDFLYADSAFFNFFGWDLLAGNPTDVINRPMTVVISEKIANQYFKNEDPIGKIINVGNESDLAITGIFKDLPEQSHIKTDFIASLSSWNEMGPYLMNGWGWHSSGFYMKINLETNIAAVEHKIADLWNLKSGDRPCTGPHVRSKLQPFKDVYLKSGKVVGGFSAIDFVIGFSVIAAFVLIISCFNFINLSIAINTKRAVENGVKKVLGANFKLFMRQVLIEMLIYLFIALFFSFIILKTLLPNINSFIDKNLSVSIFENLYLLAFIVILFLLIMALCGGIPVLQMVKAKTSNLLKGTTLLSANNQKLAKTHKLLRNSLVIAQFAIGILLVVSTLIVNKQLKLIRQHNTGFNKEHVLVIDNYEGNEKERYNLLSDKVKQYPEVKSITCGSNVPFDGISNWGGPNVYGDEQNIMQGCGFISVDYNYLDLIEAKLIEGRNFIKDRKSDKDKIIITEALAQSLNLDDPVGIKLGELWDNRPREIIGVVKNIEFNTIHNKSLPVIFFCQRENYIGYHNQIMIKLQSNNLTRTIAAIRNDWAEISPEYPMEYAFMDEKFNRNYENEMQTSIYLNIMTGVAILLCCMGLFGLALFHINARIKEIGIRKVNGARTQEVLALINKDFIVWVAIAFIISTPAAWYVMYKWLENFAYKTDMNWWIFALAGIISVVVALITVSFQSYRAAVQNPVESLKYE